MSDYSTVKTFSSPESVYAALKEENKNDAKALASLKKGSATQYIKEDTFGFFDVNRKVSEEGAGKIKSFMDNFTMMTPDNYDSMIARSSRHRSMFLKAVIDPKQFLVTKSKVAEQFENNVKDVRDQLFVTLASYDIEPVKARRDADMISKVLLDRLMVYLNNELYPSELESNIKNAALARGGIKEVS